MNDVFSGRHDSSKYSYMALLLVSDFCGEIPPFEGSAVGHNNNTLSMAKGTNTLMLHTNYSHGSRKLDPVIGYSIDGQRGCDGQLHAGCALVNGKVVGQNFGHRNVIR